MSYGLQIYNEAGGAVLNIGDMMARLRDSFELYGASGSKSIPGINSSNCAPVIQGPGVDYRNMLVIEITVSSGVIHWSSGAGSLSGLGYYLNVFITK